MGLRFFLLSMIERWFRETEIVCEAMIVASTEPWNLGWVRRERRAQSLERESKMSRIVTKRS